MRYLRFYSLFAVVCALLTACGMTPGTKTTPTVEVEPTRTPSKTPELPERQISRRPAPADYRGPGASSIPTPPDAGIPWNVDLRSSNLRGEDLSGSLDALMNATFDSKTRWPSADKLPADFDWQDILDKGKNPGLGLRALHEQGITGMGVGIAIIDQTLLVDHVEYRDQLRVYEESADIVGRWREPQVPGSVAVSIALGKTVGVAPGADLYFIATGDCGGESSFQDIDLTCRAKAIRRVIQINRTLPRGRKIRVLLLSFEWKREDRGYVKFSEEVKMARAVGIFVVSPNMKDLYGWNFLGLGRNPLADPDQFASYEPGLRWSEDFFTKGLKGDWLLAPMEARTIASPTGIKDYVYYRRGGLNWPLPYIAGVYALAKQVKPDLTPEQFWKLALDTGQTIQVSRDGKSHTLEKILDPQALIEALQKQATPED